VPIHRTVSGIIHCRRFVSVSEQGNRGGFLGLCGTGSGCHVSEDSNLPKGVRGSILARTACI
jgi:hypothetical protein